MAEPVFLAFPGDSYAWDRAIEPLPGAHFLQTSEWAQVKEAYGWEAERVVWQDEQGQILAAAQALTRIIAVGKLPVKPKMIYIPKGPLLRDTTDPQQIAFILRDLETYARSKRALFLKIDPDLSLSKGIPGEINHQENPAVQQIRDLMIDQGWRYSGEQVQFKNTVRVDLRKSEDELLAAMKQKTRYNIRLAERRGVFVRLALPNEQELLYQMYLETAVRDGFVLRDKDYYLAVWETFIQAGKCEILVAAVDELPIAAVVIMRFGGNAWYVYGMSREAHREMMPNYLLQWEAMRRAKLAGCQVYDMWGAPDVFNEGDPLWGVFRFKQGFNGEVVQWIGAWDFPVQRQGYWAYNQLMPKVLGILRRRGMQQARNLMGA